MTMVWIFCYATLVSGPHEVRTAVEAGEWMTAEQAIVRREEGRQRGEVCGVYDAAMRAVALDVVVHAPTPVRLVH